MRGTPLAIADGTVMAALHAVCYICDVATMCGVLTSKNVLGDDGILHGLIHAAAGDVTIDLKDMLDRVVDVERSLGVSITGDADVKRDGSRVISPNPSHPK